MVGDVGVVVGMWMEGKSMKERLVFDTCMCEKERE